MNWVLSEKGRLAFAKIFRIFLDEKNYPIDFHCIAGADRTGRLALVLEALLGVREDEIVEDYIMTSLSSSGVRGADSFRTEMKAFAAYPGATLQERVAGYVRDCGFSDADLIHFRELLLKTK